MSSRRMARLVTDFALAAGVACSFPGCTGEKPPPRKADEKKGIDDRNPNDGSPVSQPPRKVDLDTGAGKEAVAFLKALGEGAAGADRLSSGFVKMVGLPAELPSDKTRGFSTHSAESWLKRVGAGATFGVPAGFAASDAAVLWGGFQGQGRKGDYFLRMVNEGGAWKVDFFALTSAWSTPPAGAGDGPDAEYQRFAARAVGGLLCDRNALPKDERALALAASLTPAHRAKLADPFGSDRDQGFDYNRGKLILEAEKVGGGAESYSVIQLAPPSDLRLEVMKAGGAKRVYLLKLVKGSTQGQWLIDTITPQ